VAEAYIVALKKSKRNCSHLQNNELYCVKHVAIVIKSNANLREEAMSDDGIMEAFFMGQSHARLKIINEVNDHRSAVVAELLSVKADRDAYKFLAESLLLKLGNLKIEQISWRMPTKSWEAQIANYENDTGYSLTDRTLKRAKKLSADCVANYAQNKASGKQKKENPSSTAKIKKIRPSVSGRTETPFRYRSLSLK
jgi:hypothetical protein